jgi:hypothetical protein
MPLEDQNPQFYWPVASSPPEPAPKRQRVRRTCPKVTPFKPPSWVSKKETVGGRCNYIGPDENLCPHWRAKDSFACPCHVEAFEGPDSKARMRVKRPRKKRKSQIAVMMKPDPALWRYKEPW